MSERIKIAVVGPGGVGGYYGALLARAGMDVHLLGRGEHLKVIKEKGISVESCNGNFKTKVSAADDPDQIGVSDLILFCVKSYDTKGTAEKIRPMVGPQTVIISLQNGVENEEAMGKVLGVESVMGGVAFIGSRIKEPGMILHTAAGNISFGEIEGGTTDRGRRLLTVFENAGIEARLSDNIKMTMWRKMVWNCGFNAITALTGCNVAEILSVDETKEIVKSAMDEVVRVARNLGVNLSGDLPEKTIAHTEKQGEIKTSMLMDMEKGGRMEIDILNGAVSRLGRSSGVPTPVNDVLYGAVKAINKTRGF